MCADDPVTFLKAHHFTFGMVSVRHRSEPQEKTPLITSNFAPSKQ